MSTPTIKTVQEMEESKLGAESLQAILATLRPYGDEDRARLLAAAGHFYGLAREVSNRLVGSPR